MLGNAHQRNGSGENLRSFYIQIYGSTNITFLRTAEEHTRLAEAIEKLKHAFTLIDQRFTRNGQEPITVARFIERYLRQFINDWSDELIPPRLQYEYFLAAQKYGFVTAIGMPYCTLGKWEDILNRNRGPVDKPTWIIAPVTDPKILNALAQPPRPVYKRP